MFWTELYFALKVIVPMAIALGLGSWFVAIVFMEDYKRNKKAKQKPEGN